MRGFLDDHQPGGVVVAEADVPPGELATYFGASDTCDQMHLLFNFLLDNYLFLALARGEAEPIVRAMGLLPDKPEEAQWATFVRNLDEVDLEQLSESEQEEVYRVFGPEERMRVYGKGMRRRLAPMMNGDPARLRLAFSLLLTLPGTPVIPYGDEIGLGDDLSRPEREAVRPAMQWSAETNGGFSSAPPDRVGVPIVTDGPFGYRQVNVAAQRRDPDSLLNWLRRAITVRKEHPAFARSSFTPIETGAPSVLAHRCAREGRGVIAVHNLGDAPIAVELGLDEDEHVVDLLNPGGSPEQGRIRLDLDGYGVRWLGPAPGPH
jgi:maltose alpha-D-glucosyltransferase/alpha-amylase